MPAPDHIGADDVEVAPLDLERLAAPDVADCDREMNHTLVLNHVNLPSLDIPTPTPSTRYCRNSTRRGGVHFGQLTVVGHN